MHNAHASTLDVAAAIGLLVFTSAMWGAIVCLIRGQRKGPSATRYRQCAALVLVGVAAQVGHLQEHVAQVGFWVAHPNAPGWMTPWGSALARGFGAVDRSKPTLGMEILHLVGNMSFLAGLVGIMVITRQAPDGRARHWARIGVWMQGLHGLEHLALTLSVWSGAARAVGVSTWFGVMHPGPGLFTYRIWWHFLANVVGSMIYGMALWHLWRERRAVALSFARSPRTNQGRNPIGGLLAPAPGVVNP